MNQHSCLILADSDLFSLVVLILFVVVSLLGKLFGKKKKEDTSKGRPAHDEKVVEIDLGRLLGTHGSTPPPMARPARSPPPPPLPNRKPAPRRAPPVPVPELRIARRSKQKPRSAAQPKTSRPKPRARVSHVRVADDSTLETSLSLPPSRSDIRGQLMSHPASLRGSFLIAELLAPPVALRDPAAPSMGPPGSAV